jgi:hypothetical protein
MRLWFQAETWSVMDFGGIRMIQDAANSVFVQFLIHPIDECIRATLPARQGTGSVTQ